MLCLCRVQIAVLKETGGRGPYSSLVMAVVIVKDVVVFICFAVNIEVSDVVRHHASILHQNFHLLLSGSGVPTGCSTSDIDVGVSCMIISCIGGQVMRKSGEGVGISILLEPVTSLAVSTVLGLMFGVLIGRLLAMPARPFNALLRRLPPAAQTR